MTARPDPYVTPLVRKLAAESGVVLASLTGTGVGGRIRTADVRRAAAAQASTAPAPTTPTAPPPPPSGVKGMLSAKESLTQWDVELPPFTASGVDPRELLKLPVQERATAAAVPDRATVLAMIKAAPVWPTG